MSIEAFKLNLALSFLLVILGLWSFEASGRDLHTLSIPIMGILLSLFHKPLKGNEADLIKWISIITGIYLVVLTMPLRNSFYGENWQALLRVSLMFLATLLTLAGYIFRQMFLKKRSV